DFCVSGKTDVAGAGKSIGFFVLKPKFFTPVCIAGSPMASAPMRANAELHDTRRMSNSAPPHDSPPKLEMGLPSGGLYAVSVGKTGSSGVTTPFSTPIEPVTTLNVDPGKKRSCQ